MSRKILLLLLLLPATEQNMRPWKYKQHNGPKNWKDARAHCVERHADLLIIRSEEHNNEVKHGEGWIGLNRENAESEWRWTTGQKAEYTKWKSSGKEPGKKCAYKEEDKIEWEELECSKDKVFLCMDETLLLVQEEKTWEEALQHCRSLVSPDGTGTNTLIHNHDLVSLLTPDDHDYARELALPATTDEVWTGMRFLAGQWFWVNGETMQYPEADKCPSDVFCGTLGKTSADKFHTRLCEEKRNFLCFRELPP